MPNTVPYLCGGTFFVLLTEAKGKTKTQRQRLQEADIINNTNMLEALIKMFKPSFTQPSYGTTFKGDTSDYRACKKSYSTYLPFNEDVVIEAFDKRARTEYSSLLEGMKSFVYTYLDYKDEAKMIWLIRALIQIINDDDSILDNTKLYAIESGKPVSKKDLLKETDYNLPALLFGIWHFIITKRTNNERGRETFEYWCKPRTEKHSQLIPQKSKVKLYAQKITFLLESSDEKKGSTTDTEPVIEPKEKYDDSSINALNVLINNDNNLEEGLFIDRLALRDYINSHENLYVETKVYKEALKKIKASRTLILVGGPGVGKTMTSEMIVKDFITNGYEIACTYQPEQIPGLIKHIREKQDLKELIYVDDCLGQAYFDLTSDQENDLKKLLLLIRGCNNKSLLLNSRITIYNSVLRGETKLSKDFTYLNDKNLIYSVEELSKLEKARIFYNHLYYNQHITNAHYKNLQPEKKYLNIINHKNYTPRLMEYVTSSLFVKNLSEDKYYDKVMKTLNNPAKVWDDEYNKKIEKKDRLLLTTLFSLTNTTCSVELCKYAYEKRLGLEKDIDHSKNNWAAAIGVLNGSMIKLVQSSDNKMQIGVSDPSVNDYLANSIFHEGSSEKELLKKVAVTGNQIKRLFENYKNIFEEKTMDGSILDIRFEYKIDKCSVISAYTTKNKILRSEYKEYLLEGIKEKGNHSWDFFEFRSPDTFLSRVLRSPELYNYYFKYENLEEYLNIAFDRCHIDDLFDLISALNGLPKKLIDIRTEDNIKRIQNLFESKIADFVNDNINDRISNNINSSGYHDDDIISYYSVSDSVSDELLQDLHDCAPNEDEYEPKEFLEYYNEAVNQASLCTEDDVEQYLNDAPDFYSDDEDSTDSSNINDEVELLFEKESLR